MDKSARIAQTPAADNIWCRTFQEPASVISRRAAVTWSSHRRHEGNPRTRVRPGQPALGSGFPGLLCTCLDLDDTEQGRHRLPERAVNMKRWKTSRSKRSKYPSKLLARYLYILFGASWAYTRFYICRSSAVGYGTTSQATATSGYDPHIVLTWFRAYATSQRTPTSTNCWSVCNRECFCICSCAPRASSWQ